MLVAAANCGDLRLGLAHHALEKSVLMRLLRYKAVEQKTLSAL
jgi:hypothetical protein